MGVAEEEAEGCEADFAAGILALVIDQDTAPKSLALAVDNSVRSMRIAGPAT